MGTGSFTDQNDGEVADAVDVQQLIDAGKGDLVPRNSSGVATADAGECGTSTYPFKRANITTGYFVPGDMKFGWMKCNGDVVNETNYDAIHGAGSWAEYVVSSPLSGKNLPDCNDKYLVGSNTTTQDGTSAISSEGNTSHQVNLSHTHSTPDHNHQWYIPKSPTLDDESFLQSGASSDIISNTKSTPGAAIGSIFSGNGIALEGAPTFPLFTSKESAGTTGSNLSSTQSIKPESHAAQVWIRII